MFTKRTFTLAVMVSLVCNSSLINILRASENGPPYPIILIQGLSSSSWMWFEAGVTNHLEGFGWGGCLTTLNVCLNGDGDNATANLTTDVVNYIDPNLPEANVYLVNFDVDVLGNPFPDGQDDVLSNESAITKQGLGIKHCVEAVLNATGADKVILVGHSMGGLAAREYIQNQAFWIAGEHHVAKLVTIGTPHEGSSRLNLLDFLVEHSEAYVPATHLV